MSESINLDEVRARCAEAARMSEAATPGEWERNATNVFSPEDKAMVCQVSRPHGAASVRHVPLELSDSNEEWRQASANAEFIAASRTLLPQLAQDALALAGECERLKAQNKELEQAYEHQYLNNLHNLTAGVNLQVQMAEMSADAALGKAVRAMPKGTRLIRFYHQSHMQGAWEFEAYACATQNDHFGGTPDEALAALMPGEAKP